MQQRALAEVIQQQRRHHDREPDEADRPAAEVPEVDVERFAAGDDQDDRAEDEIAGPAVRGEEPHGVDGLIGASTAGCAAISRRRARRAWRTTRT